MTHDERFEVSAANRRGAHRARPNPLLSVLPVLALVAVIAAVVGLTALLFGGGNKVPSTTSAPTPAASVTNGAASASPPATVAVSNSPGGQANNASVDYSIVLNVYNGSVPPVTGLAKRATAPLKQAGWPIGEVATWKGKPVTKTTVYYAEPTQVVTAQAIVTSLGVGVAVQNPELARNGLTVVLGNDIKA